MTKRTTSVFENLDRRTTRRTGSFAILLLIWTWSAAAWAQQPAAPVGSPPQANNCASRAQQHPAVALDADRGFVARPEMAFAESLPGLPPPESATARVGVPARTACPGGAWISGCETSDLSSYARALTVYDDGDGPALYVGGGFTTAGGRDLCRRFRVGGTLAWSATVP